MTVLGTLAYFLQRETLWDYGVLNQPGHLDRGELWTAPVTLTFPMYSILWYHFFFPFGF